MATTKSKKRKLFKLLAPQAESVYLAASFNDWDPHARPLKKDARGLWKTSVTLPLGKHEYRFVVDGEWRDDPAVRKSTAPTPSAPPTAFCTPKPPRAWGRSSAATRIGVDFPP